MAFLGRVSLAERRTRTKERNAGGLEQDVDHVWLAGARLAPARFDEAKELVGEPIAETEIDFPVVNAQKAA